jgi:hypothetical protein
MGLATGTRLIAASPFCGPPTVGDPKLLNNYSASGFNAKVVSANTNALSLQLMLRMSRCDDLSFLQGHNDDKSE